jgi:hypothetical protein
MVRVGARSLAVFFRGGDKPSAYLDTGIELIADDLA